MKKITLLASLFIALGANAQAFSDDFNAETVDATTFSKWASLDEDGDGNFWEVFDADGTGLSWIMSGLGVDSDSWEGGTPFNPDNFLITSQPIDLTNYTSTTLSFIVGTYQTNGSFLGDKYSIYMTASNDPAVIVTETPVTTRLISDDVTAAAGDGSDSAAAITIDASAFDGQMVYLTFRHYDSFDENSVLIDDVVVDGTLSVADQSFNNFNYYVANNQLVLTASTSMEKVALYNALGQEVMVNKLASTNESVDMSALNTGIYIATVTIEGQTKSFKIVKK
ncbi:MAG: T9SS type A sorting domain-containing protein [Flavobacteriaceae bacterium]